MKKRYMCNCELKGYDIDKNDMFGPLSLNLLIIFLHIIVISAIKATEVRKIMLTLFLHVYRSFSAIPMEIIMIVFILTPTKMILAFVNVSLKNI